MIFYKIMVKIWQYYKKACGKKANYKKAYYKKAKISLSCAQICHQTIQMLVSLPTCPTYTLFYLKFEGKT